MVGTTFDRIVYDAKKDVIVRFFAAFDGKSKDLESVFEDVAKLYVKDTSIAFADVDVTKNEMPGISSNDFPRVILYRAGGNGRESVAYEGAFEEDSLKRFVETNHHSLTEESEELEL